jgi:outer membrane protein TolC
MRTVMVPGSFAVAMGLTVGMAATAHAQGPQPPAPAPAAPAAAPATGTTAPTLPPPTGPQPPGGPGAAAPSSVGPAPVVVSTGSEEATTPVEVPSDLVQANPGGLTADQAGLRASTTSWNAKAQEDNLRSAEARVDQAWAAYLPRLSGKFSYQRLSEFTPPKISLVSLNPQQFQEFQQQFGPVLAGELAGGFGFPLVFNNWSLVGTLTVPISDYFFSIGQRYSAATHSEDAARWNVIGARASALTDGKIEYYTWLRNRGAVVVTVQSLNDQKTHLRDARNQFAVGNASKADVLRAETAVSSAELALEQAENLSALTEKQLRVAMHLPEDQPILPGEDLAVALPSFQGNLKQMTLEAMSARAEIKSADANAVAAEKQAAAAKAARYPVLVASGDGIFANPNPRVFPQTQDWFGTWDAGASLSWSPNDILIANGSVSDYEAQAAAIKANQNTTRDAIEIEVQQDWQGVREADFAVDSSAREVASAEEAYRVQRELFNNGRGTSATLTDAEGDLTRARLTQLNARANARIARIRLDHALGRDIQPASAGATGPTGPRD